MGGNGKFVEGFVAVVGVVADAGRSSVMAAEVAGGAGADSKLLSDEILSHAQLYQR
jgi:hypothetical protein